MCHVCSCSLHLASLLRVALLSCVSASLAYDAYNLPRLSLLGDASPRACSRFQIERAMLISTDSRREFATTPESFRDPEAFDFSLDAQGGIRGASIRQDIRRYAEIIRNTTIWIIVKNRRGAGASRVLRLFISLRNRAPFRDLSARMLAICDA